MHLKNLESKIESIESLNYFDFNRLEQMQNFIDNISVNNALLKAEAKTIEEKLAQMDKEIDKVKRCEADLYTIRYIHKVITYSPSNFVVKIEVKKT